MPQYQGVWTLPVAARLQSNQQWVTDPLFDYTTLLLQADNAPNGAQNNTFIDSSSNNFTITRNGNTTQGTFTPYSLQPGEWSNYFPTSGYMTTSNGQNFGTGAFTVEFWLFLTAYNGSGYDAAPFGGQTTSAGIMGGVTSSGVIAVGVTGSSWNVISTGGVIPLNTWTHVAVVRTGTGSNQTSIYVNGNVVATGTISTNCTDTTFDINRRQASTTGTACYFSNVRIVKSAVYTSSFTPTTRPLTAIANTSFLTCQSNRFVDNSGNSYTLNLAGSPSVQAFSPFAPQYQWTAPVIGGSGYFDGNGDYLTLPVGAIPSGAGTEFTIEFWINQPSLGGTVLRANGNGSSLSISISGSGQIGLDNVFVASILTTTGTITANAWNHVAITRTTANLYTVYINGVSAGSATYTGSLGSQQQFIGYNTFSGAFLTAYISGFRCVNSVVYASAFAPPTIPPTAIANTGLLLNFTNAGIVDGTMKNNLETFGNAQVSTSVVKYGTGSISFDGTGDYLVGNTATADLYAFGTGDFTIEMWAYPTSITSSLVFLFDSRPTSTNGAYPSLYIDNTGTIYYVNSAARITGDVLLVNTWTHIAISRSGTNTRMFINGAQSGATYSDTTNYLGSAQRPAIASSGSALNTSLYTGYIDDFRITKGVARYITNFTPPTVALPRQ